VAPAEAICGYRLVGPETGAPQDRTDLPLFITTAIIVDMAVCALFLLALRGYRFQLKYNTQYRNPGVVLLGKIGE